MIWPVVSASIQIASVRIEAICVAVQWACCFKCIEDAGAMDCIDLKTVTMFVLGGSQNGRTEWADDRGGCSTRPIETRRVEFYSMA